MDQNKREQLAEVIEELAIPVEAWEAAIDPDLPVAMQELLGEVVQAYPRGDAETLLSLTDPEIEIAQPRDFPGTRTYHGHDGLLEALLDWPREWEDFSVTPTRVFSPDGRRLIIQAVHRGTARHSQIAVEGEVVWVWTWRGARLWRWDMFMNVETALDAVQTG
jgi:ketosteroid isomerase-like protein